MSKNNNLSIALVWAQFAAYHVDRCVAVARRMEGRATVLAVEMATASTDYAWEPSGEVAGTRKLTLFPGRSYESLPSWRRFLALYGAVRHADWVFIGLSYAEPYVVALTWLLRMQGKRLVIFSESKADDRPRRRLGEAAKRLALACYDAAIVGAARHVAYFRSLGFRRRPVLPGYDGVSVDRVREQTEGRLAPHGCPFAERPFVFIGRFVDKKNLPNMMEAYADYAVAAGPVAHRLVLAGAGPEEVHIREIIAMRGIDHLVEMPGFLPAEAVSRLLADALALVLVSREEQWGLVVNEALALGLPVIVSHQVGSRDALVRDGVNGFVVDSESEQAICRAMTDLAANEVRWQDMVKASHGRSWLGDTDRLAEAVEAMTFPSPSGTLGRMDEFLREALEYLDRRQPSN